jgi:methyltransferase
MRHPNYLAVIVEIAALPLVHTAWITAIAFSLLNGWLLTVRIKVEQGALDQAGANEKDPPATVSLSRERP